MKLVPEEGTDSACMHGSMGGPGGGTTIGLYSLALDVVLRMGGWAIGRPAGVTCMSRQQPSFLPCCPLQRRTCGTCST